MVRHVDLHSREGGSAVGLDWQPCWRLVSSTLGLFHKRDLLLHCTLLTLSTDAHIVDSSKVRLAPTSNTKPLDEEEAQGYLSDPNFSRETDGSYDVTAKDLRRLQPRRWLCDAIINCYVADCRRWFSVADIGLCVADSWAFTFLRQYPRHPLEEKIGWFCKHVCIFF
jgi:hypothetical protein